MTNNWLIDNKIAHRGLHNDKLPENSLGAFENAITHGFTIELDVHLLKDNQLAVFHDDNLNRMCNADISIKDLTINQLNNYKLDNSQYTIPTFDEALQLINGTVPVIIEIKPTKHRYLLAKLVYEKLKNYKGIYAIKSFDHLIVRWFKKHAPEVTRGLLSSLFKGLKLNWLYKFVISKLLLVKTTRPDFISYHWQDIPNKYTTKYCKKYNIPLIAWTIKSKEEEEHILQYADNIIFDNYIPKKSIKNKGTR